MIFSYRVQAKVTAAKKKKDAMSEETKGPSGVGGSTPLEKQPKAFIRTMGIRIGPGTSVSRDDVIMLF